ncbi:hypothetical protein [Lacipirellula limnantheis]|uniref:hypothetical protein n=1 Tax=Lacipirellula limnantheis TaxID=2528024 RepID=UPI0011A2AF37|nr:hypothetical protein [Lacipirellula limnantheis]
MRTDYADRPGTSGNAWRMIELAATGEKCEVGPPLRQRLGVPTIRRTQTYARLQRTSNWQVGCRRVGIDRPQKVIEECAWPPAIVYSANQRAIQGASDAMTRHSIHSVIPKIPKKAAPLANSTQSIGPLRQVCTGVGEAAGDVLASGATAPAVGRWLTSAIVRRDRRRLPDTLIHA